MAIDFVPDCPALAGQISPLNELLRVVKRYIACPHRHTHQCRHPKTSDCHRLSFHHPQSPHLHILAPLLQARDFLICMIYCPQQMAESLRPHMADGDEEGDVDGSVGVDAGCKKSAVADKSRQRGIGRRRRGGNSCDGTV